jgi:hypothetical protein
MRGREFDGLDGAPAAGASFGIAWTSKAAHDSWVRLHEANGRERAMTGTAALAMETLPWKRGA